MFVPVYERPKPERLLGEGVRLVLKYLLVGFLFSVMLVLSSFCANWIFSAMFNKTTICYSQKLPGADFMMTVCETKAEIREQETTSDEPEESLDEPSVPDKRPDKRPDKTQVQASEEGP